MIEVKLLTNICNETARSKFYTTNSVLLVLKLHIIKQKNI